MFILICQSERAARKATVLQMATMYTVLGGALLNIGVNLSSQGNQAFANGSFVGAGDFIPQFLSKDCFIMFNSLSVLFL